MSNTNHLSEKQETNSIQTGYKLIGAFALVILGLILLNYFRNLTFSHMQQKNLKLHTVSQILPSNQEQVERPWLGLEVTDVTLQIAIQAGLDKVQGALVQSIVVGSPACKAGMKPGDIIMSLEGRRVRTADEFKNDISGFAVGSEINMCITRDDYRTTLTAVLGSAPEYVPFKEKISPWLGVEVSEITSEKDEERLEDLGKDGGVFVEKVFPGSPAFKAGIEPGDVLMSYNYRKIRVVEEFLPDLSGSQIGDRVRICLMRGEIRKTVYPVLEEKPQNSPLTFVGDNYTEDQTAWGLIVSPVTESLRERYSIPTEINGVIVMQVESDGIAAKSGLLPGDLITAINQKPISDIQTFLQSYSDVEQGALVEIYRNKSFEYISLGSSSLGTQIVL